MIHIRFYANMRTITGQANLEIAHSSARTLCELLTRLIELFPNFHQYILDERGNLYQDVPIFVNGRNPRLISADFKIPLDPDDVISLFSPISSGRMNVEVMRTLALEKQE